MESRELAKNIVKFLDSKKADDIQVIKIRELSIIADYFIIAGGRSSTQVKTLADEVEAKTKELGKSPERKEGIASANWIILDYLDVVVHIFYGETREFYKLEKLWADGEKIDISDMLTGDRGRTI
ncbi:MAG: ribosome silencing factor [Oscillospiraceae bacterium]|nr:ribosome silencing factor [Oscillospiraceae bacterium]